MTELRTENIRSYAKRLRAGERILLTGVVFTARDAAHRRLFELLDKGERLPFDLNGAIIYYTGPTPTPDGRNIGSCGPTTSGRMDKYTPRLLDLGLGAMIGKGQRSEEVCKAIARNGTVYFCAIGGAGAFYSQYIKSVEELAFPDLGCESVKRLGIEKMPLTVAIDCRGGDIFVDGRKEFLAR